MNMKDVNRYTVNQDVAMKLFQKGFKQKVKGLCDGKRIVMLVANPTIFEVLDWLVTEKNIFVEVHAHATMATVSKMAYFCYVRHSSDGVHISCDEPCMESFGRCKDAYLAGINYAVKNLI